MKITIAHTFACLVGAGAVVAIALAPVAAADTDPLVPYGTNPTAPYLVGLHTSNHDELDTTNGQVDLPF